MKNKFLTVLVLLIVSSTSNCYAQSAYGNYYHDIDSVGNSGLAVSRLLDGKLFLLGGSTYSISSYVRIGGIILSPNGDSLLEYHLQNRPPANIYSDYGTLLPQANGDIITHQNFSSPSTPAKNYKTTNASVVRFKPNGDTAWVKTYTDTNVLWQAPAGLSQSSLDGSFVVSGLQYPAASLSSVGFLMFLDSAANIKRQMVFYNPAVSNPALNFIQRAAFLPDGKRVLATCAARTDYSAVGGFYSKFHPWLFICDTQGVIQKQRILPQRYQGGGRSPFAGIDRNGGYYMGGGIDSVVDRYGQPTNDYSFPKFLMHLDTNLNTEWVYSFGDSSHGYYFQTVKQLHNGNYLLIGSSFVDTTRGDAGWLAVVNTDGSLKWSRRYHKSTQWNHRFYDAVENADGSITAVGSGKSDTSSPQTSYDLWVLNVDSNGCEGPGICNGSLSVEEGSPVAKETGFKIYPNPTTGALYVESDKGGEATLYNLTGNKVWEQRIISGKTAVSLPPALAAGIYVVRFVAADGAVFQTRLTYNP